MAFDPSGQACGQEVTNYAPRVSLTAPDTDYETDGDCSLASRLASATTRVVFVCTIVLAAVQQLPMLTASGWSLFDLRIYRDATHLVLHGGADQLYTAVFNGGWVYTYPPFSIAMFAPVDPMPEALATGITTLGSVLALARICWLAGRAMVSGWLGDHDVTVGIRLRGVASYLLASALLLLLIQTDPVKGTFGFGQVNLVLAWLVMEDYLGLGTSPAGVGGIRGALTGIAGGIKLTPALSWVPRALAGDRRPAVIGAVAGAATIALSALVLPRQTWDFFTRIMLDTSRPGDVWTEWNQSLSGMTHRLLGPNGPTTVPTIVLVAIALICGMYAATVLLRRGDRLGCVLVSALTTALVSPISWYHHLVLLPLLFVWVAARWRALPTALAGLLQVETLLLAVWLVPGLYQSVPRDNGAELHHTFGQTLVSEAVPLLGLVIVATLALAMLSRGSASRETDGARPD